MNKNANSADFSRLTRANQKARKSLTLWQSGGTDYAHHIFRSAYSPGERLQSAHYDVREKIGHTVISGD